VIDLDQFPDYEDIDREDMLSRILGMPSQLRQAWSLVQSLSLPSHLRDAEHIVVVGMGGSAIGADLMRTLAETEARVPVSVVRDYDLPAYVGERSLVLLSSFSGTTEEVLSAADHAVKRNAKIVAITGGGLLAERMGKSGVPIIRFRFDGLPREALGFSTLGMIGTLAQLGYISDKTTDVDATATALEQLAGELGPQVPAERNPAKRLAQHLSPRLGLIYGGGLMAEVARRWKGQINANAKSWAFCEQLPELNHNALLGYLFPSEIGPKVWVVILSSRLNHPRTTLRGQVTQEELNRRGIQSTTIEARGGSVLEHLFTAAYVGDWVSYYLALVHEVDPSDDSALQFFKTRLSQLDVRGNGHAR
jgi:glucose/mannose-6-phosphate isomerase